MEHKLKTDKNGMMDITDLENICTGDILNINGCKQKVIDIHEASIFIKLNGKEMEYAIDVNNNNPDQTYLKKIE